MVAEQTRHPAPSGAVWDAPTADVVARLRGRFGAQAFGIVERWDADVCTVGLVRGASTCALAIITTCGCAAGHYDVLLERTPAPGCEGDFVDAGRQAGVDFETLAALVAHHLGISAAA